jgi:hypothetical protein
LLHLQRFVLYQDLQEGLAAASAVACPGNTGTRSSCGNEWSCCADSSISLSSHVHRQHSSFPKHADVTALLLLRFTCFQPLADVYVWMGSQSLQGRLCLCEKAGPCVGMINGKIRYCKLWPSNSLSKSGTNCSSTVQYLHRVHTTPSTQACLAGPPICITVATCV